MKLDWQNFLISRGARIDGGRVADFRHPADELIAARDATIIVPLAQFGLLEANGEDALPFLQNQLTSDIRRLSANTAQYSAWCSAKGRILASFLLYRQNGSFRMLLSADLLETIPDRLRKYILRSRLTLQDRSSDFEFIGLAGPDTGKILHTATLPWPEQDMGIATLAEDAIIRLDERRALIAITSEAKDFWQKLAPQAIPCGVPAWQWHEVRAGIVFVGQASREAFVPQTVNLDRVGGLSFHKGCYPGQEVVSRAQYLGKLKRRLYRLHADGPLAPGQTVFAQDRPEPCGLIASAAPSPEGGSDALAVLLESEAETGTLRVKQSEGQSAHISHLAPA